MSYYSKVLASTGLKLQPDTPPYTGTTLSSVPGIVDGIWTTNYGEFIKDYSYGVDFGTAKPITRLFVFHTYGDTWRTPYIDYATMELYYSNDNATWTLIQEYIAPTHTIGSSAGSGFVVDFTSVNARYYKIVNTSNYSFRDSGNYSMDVYEIIGYETLAGSAPLRAGEATSMNLSPTDIGPGLSLSTDLVTVTCTTQGRQSIRANKAIPSSGKWYWEVEVLNTEQCSTSEPLYGKGVGIGLESASLTDRIGGNAQSWSVISSGYSWYDSNLNPNGFAGVPLAFCKYAATYGPTIGLAYNADAGELYFKFPDWDVRMATSDPVVGVDPPLDGILGEVFPMLSLYSPADRMRINFGGAGFNYEVPTGFLAVGDAYFFADETICTWNPADRGSNLLIDKATLLTATHA